jgi:hypothetical protein
MDPKRPGIIPLIYIGLDEEFPARDNEICERWIGPAGEHVYHVHESDDDKWFGYAGGDFLRRKRADCGRAYVGLTASHPYWVVTGIRSAVAHLTPARIFLSTMCSGLPENLTKGITPETETTSIEAAELRWIRERSASPRIKMPLRLDFADRFLAKVALGLGHAIVGPAFSGSSYADQLRELLWRRSPSDGDDLKIFGTSFWQSHQFGDLSKMVSFNGAWTILVTCHPEGLSMMICTPSGRIMTMMILDDIRLMAGSMMKQYQLGEVYLALPQKQMFIGPISLPAYLAHKNGSCASQKLSELESMKIDGTTLPPRNWAESTND